MELRTLLGAGVRTLPLVVALRLVVALPHTDHRVAATVEVLRRVRPRWAPAPVVLDRMVVRRPGHLRPALMIQAEVYRGHTNLEIICAASASLAAHELWFGQAYSLPKLLFVICVVKTKSRQSLP